MLRWLRSQRSGTCVAMLVERWLHHVAWNFSGWARGQNTTTARTRHRPGASAPWLRRAPRLQRGAFVSWTLPARAGGRSARSTLPLLRCYLLACRLISTRLRRPSGTGVEDEVSGLWCALGRLLVHGRCTTRRSELVYERRSEAAATVDNALLLWHVTAISADEGV